MKIAAAALAPCCFLLLLPALSAAQSSTGGAGAAAQAGRELLAGRYEAAIPLFSKLAGDEPGNGAAWYGLVLAQLRAHHARDAYASAGQALAKAGATAGARTAAGIAAFRRGEIPEAGRFFAAALRIDPDNPAALTGLARVSSAVSMFGNASQLRLRASKSAPDDPELKVAYADTVKGGAHIAALRAALARLDPASEQAARLRVHIANDVALGDRRLNRLVSPYQSESVKLFLILDGVRNPIGAGLVVRLNGKQTAQLLLDTGATGISISPKLAEKAGLEVVSGAAGEVKGIGDGKVQSSIDYIAQKLQIGNLEFADYSLSAFRSAKSAHYDGLIGPDALSRFLVRVDFPHLEMSLEPRPVSSAADSNQPSGPVNASPKLAEGFSRLYRIGDHLFVPTFINDAAKPVLFLVDSGSSTNIIDVDTAHEFTHTSNDPRLLVKGVQGSVRDAWRAGRLSLRFANFRQDNPDLIAMSLDSLSEDMGVACAGILGMPTLSHLVVTLDYLEGAIRFDYNKPR